MHQLLSPDYINTPSSRGVKSTRKTEAAPEAAPLLVLPSPPRERCNLIFGQSGERGSEEATAN